MREYEISEGKGYEIFVGQDGNRVSKETVVSFSIHFRKEGNNNIIKTFEELGWVKAKV